MPLIDPKDCANPVVTREQIDLLDRELIALLRKRREYGERIAEQYGPEAINARAMDPFLQMMKDRRAWGDKEGLDSHYIDQVFTVIAQSYFDRRLEDTQKARIFRTKDD
ncbi:MAG: chorismate mutase [Planctomycetes bacterium]|nr:chorismate mutase [Planctomycetota bacterium]